MTYIGGAGHFAGPILGAVTLTWLQTSLSGYTSAWLLYLGLFFVLTILFAPSGLSGLILMHGPIARTRAFRGVLVAYAIALVPAMVMACGAVLLIEMSYRLATQPELGSRMRLFSVAVDAATAWPWVAGVLMLAGGLLAFRGTWRLVGSAWERATEEARVRRAATRSS